VVVLELHQGINLDPTGLDALRSLHRLLRRRTGALVIAEPNEQPLSLMRRSGFIDQLGGESAVFDDLTEALAAVRAGTAGRSGGDAPLSSMH